MQDAKRTTLIEKIDNRSIQIQGFNIAEVTASVMFLTYAVAGYQTASSLVVASPYDTVAAAYCLLIGLVIIFEKMRGKGSWFEVIIGFLTYFGYAAVCQGTLIRGLNQYNFMIFVACFWIFYNSTGEIQGWTTWPRKLWADYKATQTAEAAKPKEPKIQKPPLKQQDLKPPSRLPVNPFGKRPAPDDPKKSAGEMKPAAGDTTPEPAPAPMAESAAKS